MGQKQNQYKLRFRARVPPSPSTERLSAHTLDPAFQMRLGGRLPFPSRPPDVSWSSLQNSESVMISALAGMLEAITLHGSKWPRRALGLTKPQTGIFLTSLFLDHLL